MKNRKWSKAVVLAGSSLTVAMPGLFMAGPAEAAPLALAQVDTRPCSLPGGAPTSDDVMGSDKKARVLAVVDKIKIKHSQQFAGVTWDGCAGRIVIKRKKLGSLQLDQDVKSSLRTDADALLIEDAKSTAVESDAILDWMQSKGVAWVAARGGKLTGWEGYRDGVSVWVGIEGVTDALKSELAAKFPGMLVIESTGKSQQEYSRTLQPSPFWGGVRSYAQLQDGAAPTPCTIGPVVYHTVNTGWVRALTAGHCGYLGTTFTHPATNYDRIGYIEYLNFQSSPNGTDAALVRPNVGFGFAGKVWENDYSRDVAGYTTGLAGDRVIMSGGISQTKTNLYLQGDPQKNNCYALDGNYKCGAVTYVQPGNVATQPTFLSFSEGGDSGSPVYSQSYPTYIYGMHLGKFRAGLDYRGVYVKVMSALSGLYDGKWAVKRG